MESTETRLALLEAKTEESIHRNRNDRLKIELMMEEIDSLQRESAAMMARVRVTLGIIGLLAPGAFVLLDLI